MMICSRNIRYICSSSLLALLRVRESTQTHSMSVVLDKIVKKSIDRILILTGVFAFGKAIVVVVVVVCLFVYLPGTFPDLPIITVCQLV